MTDPWSGWQIYPDWHPDLLSFRETLDGGQTFCWFRENETTFSGVVKNFPIRFRWESPDRVHWSTMNPLSEEVNRFLVGYLRTDAQYEEINDRLPWRSDGHLQRCMELVPHLRILGQSPDETLLGFLCSATKQIVQIKEMLSLLRQRFGTELTQGYRSLPTWNQLLHTDEMELRDCKFGFRAKNIKKTAEVLPISPGFLESLASVSYENARTQLCTLPGVGGKIADCVLLFGYQKLEAFPVDTWILKAMHRHYHLSGWTNPQIAHFGRAHFGPYAGMAQQFLFAWERGQGRK